MYVYFSGERGILIFELIYGLSRSLFTSQVGSNRSLGNLLLGYLHCVQVIHQWHFIDRTPY